MKIKRIISFILALSLAVVTASCGKETKDPLKSADSVTEGEIKNTSWEKKASGYDTITLFYDEEKVSDEDLTGAYPAAVSNDKIYYFKPVDPESVFASETNGYIVDMTDSSVTADDHDETEARKIIYRDDKKMVYYGTGEEDDKIFSSDLNGGNKKILDTEKVWYAHSDSSGNIYVMERNNILKYFDSSFNLVKQTDLSDQMSQDLYLSDLCVSDDGKIYFIMDLKYEYYTIYTLDENDKLTKLTGENPLGDIVTGFFTDKDGNVVLTSQQSVDVIDPKTGDLVHMYDLYGVNDFIGPSENYDMVYVCSDGIYGYSYEDDSKELIVSDDKLPKLASNFRSAYLNGNSLYVALADVGSSYLYEIDRKTGETIITECEGNGPSCISPDGTFYYISSEHMLKGSDDGYTYESVCNSVYRHEKDGNDTPLFTLPELHFEAYTGGMIMNSSGDLMIVYQDEEDNACIMVYDTTGNLKNTIFPEVNEEHYGISLVRNDNNTEYIVVEEYGPDEPCKIYKYDHEKCDMGEKVTSFSYSDSWPVFRNGYGDHDIIMYEDTEILGWNENTGKTESIASFSEFTSNCYRSGESLAVSDTEILCNDGIKLVKADEERLAVLNSREVITLAVPYDYNTMNLVSEFNKKSDTCYILTKDYSKYWNDAEADTGKSYNDIVGDALSRDIINNDIPDIIMMDNLDLSAYIMKGLFTDLRQIADADPQFDPNSISGYITDLFTYNDCLYTIPAGIIQSVLFSDEKHEKWDYNEFASLDTGDKDLFPYNNLVFNTEYMYYDNAIANTLLTYYTEHVDLAGKKCDFDNDEFASLIKFLKQEVLTSEEVNELNESGDYLNREYILVPERISSVNDYLQETGVFFNSTSDIKYVSGWPSDKGGTRIIEPVMSFGITSSSEHKESAWEFIRYILGVFENNYQNGQYSYITSDGYSSISISCVSSNSSLMENQINEDVKMSYSDEYTDFTSEDEKAYRSIYTMPAVTDMMYRKVSDIVNSELDEYFYSEDRTAEEVVKSIQNKVTLYLNELS